MAARSKEKSSKILNNGHSQKSRINASKPNYASYNHMTTTIALELQEENDIVKHAELVKHVKELLIMSKVEDEGVDDLIMVDVLQRLGIDYHFEDEIHLLLKRHHFNFHKNQNLYQVSLCFRILRQQGYRVSSDVFKKFMGKNNKFEEKLRKDIRGLIELYEASQFGIPGENILDEAAKFSYYFLEKAIPFLDDDEANMLRSTLQNPYRKSLSLFNVKNFTKDYNGTILQHLAELEFAMAKSTHQKELNQILRWWKEVGLGEELKLARDQPLKWYIWPMAGLTSLNLSKERVHLTKVISLIYVIDDIFDIYGTCDQLTLFTQAVHRWDIDNIEQLPYFTKSTFRALYDVTNEIASECHDQHGFNPINSLRESWSTLCNAFLMEAKWFAYGELPTADDYLKNGITSTGVQVVLVHMFFVLGGCTSKESVNTINDNQGIIYCLSTILRLCDDLGSAKDENQDGHDGSYVTYYMKENKGCSIEEAQKHVMEMITDTWKSLNKEYLYPYQFSTTFTKASLNFARMIPLMYSYDKNHSLPLLDNYIKSTL